ncbi:MAG: hypothetical protein H7259_00995, partial [Cytophagales bacterium]|nr:hypothetical protein [Cytophaga sp.]
MNVIHNFSLDRACKKIKSFSFRLHLVAFIAFLSVSGSMVQAATITSTADGDWNAPTTWAGGVVPLPTDNVIINNAIVFNVPISIAGTYTFNADCGGAGNLTLSSGGILDVKANVDFSGNGNTLTGGTIYVRTGYTLSAGSAVSQTGALIVIEPDGFFYVNGDYTNNGGSIQLDGELYVGGNYLGLNAASITGTGTFISTGTMTGTVGSTIFGQANSSCTDPSGCDGNA